jgi:poly-gamma-glutamate synthesis protein (capsule biosynthesis protein)
MSGKFGLTGEGIRSRANIVSIILVLVSLGVVVFALVDRQKPPEPVQNIADTELAEEENDAPDPLIDTPRNFTLAAVGDIMLARRVGKKIESLGVDFPFEYVAGLLSEADLTFGNLESPISSLGTAVKGKEVTLRAAPQTVGSIKKAGIDVVSLANNHAMDYGEAALMETMDILAHNGIIYTGAGANSAAARRPASFEINGIKVLFLAYSYRFHMVVEAQQEHPGVAIARGEDVRSDIEKAKECADIVIVSFHWGWEYSDHPDKETRELAHLAVESGANLVIGHHPHVIQGVEAYRGGLICYSLGNFIFDQRGTRTRRGLILRCSIGRSGVQRGELLPVVIDALNLQPSLAAGEVAESILTELKRLSKQLGTTLELEANIAAIDLATGLDVVHN